MGTQAAYSGYSPLLFDLVAPNGGAQAAQGQSKVFRVRARRLKIPSMKKEGTIVRWDDARGFGFIRSPASTADVFVHVRDFRSNAGSPRQGMQVTFEEIHVGGKGPRAMAVQPAGPARAQPDGGMNFR